MEIGGKILKLHQNFHHLESLRPSDPAAFWWMTINKATHHKSYMVRFYMFHIFMRNRSTSFTLQQFLKATHGKPFPFNRLPLNARGPMDVTKLGISTRCSEAQPSKASIASIVSDAGRVTDRSTGQLLKAPISIKVTSGWSGMKLIIVGVSWCIIINNETYYLLVVLWCIMYHYIIKNEVG